MITWAKWVKSILCAAVVGSAFFPSLAYADVLSTTCLNELNANQISFDSTVGYGSNSSTTVDLATKDQSNACAAYGWVRMSKGTYTKLHIAPVYNGPDINRFAQDQNAWDCNHSSVEWAAYKKSGSTYSKVDGGMLMGSFENGHCLHNGRGFASTGHVDTNLTNVSETVVAVKSWQHNDTSISHTGTYCSGPNCYWPSRVSIDRTSAVLAPSCPDSSCFVANFQDANDLNRVLSPSRGAQDTRASVFTSTAKDIVFDRTTPVKVYGSTSWIELLAEDANYDISPNNLWRASNRGCVDIGSQSLGVLTTSPFLSCSNPLGLSTINLPRYLTSHPYVLGTQPTDLDFQNRTRYTQPLFFTVNNSWFDLVAVNVKFGRADVYVLGDNDVLVRSFLNLGPGNNATLQFDAKKVVIVSAGASRFGIDSSHLPVAIENVTVGSP